jgi:hypothetical protein
VIITGIEEEGLLLFRFAGISCCRNSGLHNSICVHDKSNNWFAGRHTAGNFCVEEGRNGHKRLKSRFEAAKPLDLTHDLVRPRLAYMGLTSSGKTTPLADAMYGARPAFGRKNKLAIGSTNEALDQGLCKNLSPVPISSSA